MRLRWERRLVTVIAGPGFGKTVLLGTAMDERAHPGAGLDLWLSCEPADEAADHLWAGLAEAVGIVAGTDIQAIFDWVWSHAPQQVCIVFDDVHEIPAGSTGARLLERLVTELPRNGHLLLASRDVIPIATARLAASGELVRVTERDLSFDQAELEAFALARSVDAGLLASSGGWPAVAELAASAGADLVFDYLWEEVLTRVGPERTRMLALLAVTGGGDDEIASCLAEQPVRVSELVAAVPLVARGESGWVALHALWRPALRHVLTDEEANDARRRVAAVHRDRGRLDIAFDLLVEAEAWDDALDVIGDSANGPRAEAFAATAQFGRWRRALPQHFQQAPEALLAAGLELQTRSPMEALAMLEAAAAGFRSREDGDGELSAIAAEGLIRWWANDVAGLLALYERVQVLAAAGSQSAAVLAAIGLAAVAHLAGDPAAVLSALASVGDEYLVRWRPIVHWFRSVAHRRNGDLVRAYAELDAITGTRAVDDPQADIARLRTDWLQGRVDDVPTGLDRIRAHYAESGDRFFETEITLELASKQAWLGDVDAAVSVLDSAAETAALWPGTPARMLVLIARTAAAIANGDECEAARLLDEAGVTDLAPVDRLYWRDRGAAAIVHVLVPAARDRWAAESQTPAHAPGIVLAESLEAVRDGNLTPVAELRWPKAGVIRAQLPLPWAVELACAGIAAGNAPPDDLLRALGPRLRPALVALEARSTGIVATTATRLASEQPAVPLYRLRIDLLGPLELRRDGAVVTHRDMGRQRVREVLAYLVSRRRVRRETVADELWPELEDPGHNLRVNLSHLQRVLQPDRAKQEPPFFLRTDGPWLELEGGELLAVDVWELERHLDDADSAERAGAPAAAIECCRAALELWRGEPYVDVPFAEWADLERTRLRSRFTAAATRAGELLLAAGATSEARRAARCAIDADRTWEPAYQLLARAHLADGDLASARRAVEDCVASLAELGLEPDVATVRLAAAGSG